MNLIRKALQDAGLTLGVGRIVQGYTTVNANIRRPGELDIDLAAATAVGVAPAITGLTVTEYGDDVVHKTVFDMAGFALTMGDTAQGGGAQLYTFPLGRILVLGAYASMQAATHSILANTLNTGVTCNWGVGTVVQANATLATTEQNLIPVTAFTAGTTIDVLNTVTHGALAASAFFDGTATAKAVFLNLAVAGATDIDGDASMLITGRLELVWSLIGAN